MILAAVSGAGLALAGLVMQASVQNPLAEPFILGIASGASVGAVVAILLGGMLTVHGHWGWLVVLSSVLLWLP